MRILTLVVLFMVSVFAGYNLGLSSQPTQATQEHVCICHNVDNNPHEVCSALPSILSGHGLHLTSGKDTWGSCVTTPRPSHTPTPTVSPTPQVEPQVTPEPTKEPEITRTESRSEPLSESKAPSCSEPSPAVGSNNFHVIRLADKVIAKWIPGDGAIADIFYKENHVNGWPHAWTGSNTGYVVIDHLVPSESYTFKLKTRNRCSDGTEVSPVVVDGPLSRLFTTTYWVKE